MAIPLVDVFVMSALAPIVILLGREERKIPARNSPIRIYFLNLGEIFGKIEA